MDDRAQIEQLKYRYLRCLDSKDWTGFEACFVPEATGAYGELSFPNRAALVEFMRTNMGPTMISMHNVHHPEIAVDGDLATGVWYLQDKVIVQEFDYYLEGAAFYDDRYVRTDEGWRIAHTGYTRTYEMSYALSSLKNLQLKNPHSED